MSDANSNSQSVAAVVVTYNRKALLAKCLDSLLAESRALDAIFVIDNASSDGTAETISEHYAGRVTYERLAKNTGGAGGFYHGMKLAHEAGFDWIWLMDDDVTPAPDCLDQLLRESRAARVLVPLRVSPDGTNAEGSAVAAYWNTPGVRRLKGDRVFDLYPDLATIPDVIRLEDFSFEGPLFHRSVVERVGYPRRDFFVLCDDTEYAWRILTTGPETLLCVTAARMIRQLPETAASPVSTWRRYYFNRNALILKRMYSKTLQERFELACYYGLATVKAFVANRFSGEILGAQLHAWVDSHRRVLPVRYR
jgi:GT2 family glycosyltransferase